MLSVQVIDEEKQFQNSQILQYFKPFQASLGLNYHVVSVFGSQSTGKSTLLNNLFNTKFDVMDESKRQQTTKGIWLSYSKDINSNLGAVEGAGENPNLLIMDVEGSDGRERGEDQDFERKAALFALATSQVLIVNLWEHQVGLYQGANMGLLKTVFEVNLSLFGNKINKVTLLFVIRDHFGSTPLENLSNTLTTDLLKIWDSITSESDDKRQLFDYFELKFHTLSHKFLQPEEFHRNIKSLGDLFIDDSNSNYLFQREKQQFFPLDGWILYSENCWDQIQNNKDLDLPTQQILVSRFKCEEIIKESIDLFNVKYEELAPKIDTLTDNLELSNIFRQLIETSTSYFDDLASHYNKAVYQEKKLELNGILITKLLPIYKKFVKLIINSSLQDFNSTVEADKKTTTFNKRLVKATDSTISNFTNQLSIFESFQFDQQGQDLQDFQIEIAQRTKDLTKLEIDNLIKKILKKNHSLIKHSTVELISNDLDDEIWDKLLSNFQSIRSNAISKYKDLNEVYNFEIGNSNEAIYNRYLKESWLQFDAIIHDHLSNENVLQILINQFQKLFYYDSNGLPKIWQNQLEISNNYTNSTQKSLSYLSLLSIAKLSSGKEIKPDYTFLDENNNGIDDAEEVDDDSDSDDDSKPHKFSHILSSSQQSSIKQKFLRQVELSYHEANRSIVINATKIPPFIYVLLLILGWNEFMMILKNPLYLILTILIGTGFFFINTLNLWGPLNTTSQILIKQGKDYLATLLLDDHHTNTPIRSSVSQEFTDNIELKDLKSD